MNTLSFAQFLYMIEKTHCTCYQIGSYNGFYIARLGVRVGDGKMLSLWKSRPFKEQSKFDKIVALCRKYHLFSYQNPLYIYTR